MGGILKEYTGMNMAQKVLLISQGLALTLSVIRFMYLKIIKKESFALSIFAWIIWFGCGITLSVIPYYMIKGFPLGYILAVSGAVLILVCSKKKKA